MFTDGVFNKNGARIEALGAVNELNALIGIIRSHKLEKKIDKALGHKSTGDTMDYLGIRREQLEDLQVDLNL